MNAHPWTLVGPWYRAESAGGGVPKRSKRPIFQKYASSDFVNKFIAEPQESLKFVCEDFANRLCLDPYALVGPGKTGQGSDYLKLFLDTHSRFYIVICELHCLAPGFPNVNRDQVCEAGFVVRRHVTSATREARLQLARALRQRNTLKTKILKINEQEKLPQENKKTSIKQLVGGSLSSFRKKKLAQLQEDFLQTSEELQKLCALYDVKTVLQGWVPGGTTQGVGSWETVEDTPQVVTEEIHPLFPLIPDPDQTDHSVQGKTLWFGVVPTQSADVDREGYAKFDDDHLYEVRCYVRRHQPQCPKALARDDCKGALFWSAPTEGYRLAPFFDLDGTGHKPINIKLPDFSALEAQANRGPVGKGANVRMIAPDNSGLQFTTDGMELPTGTGVRSAAQICFFAIPLITIVALFVLRLFLPIVVFLFQLWFLLKLKLCIPPSLSFDADIAADIKVHGPEFEASIQASIDIDGSVVIAGVEYFSTAAVAAAIAAQVNADSSLDPALKAGMTTALDFDDLADLYVTMATDFTGDPPNPEMAGKIPLPEDGLFYFEKV